MGARFDRFDSLASRDAKIARLKARLSLAHAARNRMEITRLAREVKRLSQSL